MVTMTKLACNYNKSHFFSLLSAR